jgi:hypothetical protein
MSTERRATYNMMDAVGMKRHQFQSPDLKYTYHISLIDYLQEWNLNKKAERFAKTKFLQKDWKQLSATPPKFY